MAEPETGTELTVTRKSKVGKDPEFTNRLRDWVIHGCGQAARSLKPFLQTYRLTREQTQSLVLGRPPTPVSQ
jgi:hypothetical protein